MKQTNGMGRHAAEEEALRSVICANLNAIVDERGMTKSELASAIGVSNRAASKWLSGEGGIDIDHIKQICDFFDLPVHYLLGEQPSYKGVPLASRQALELFESLDSAAQAKVIDYMEDLVATGKYARSDR